MGGTVIYVPAYNLSWREWKQGHPALSAMGSACWSQALELLKSGRASRIVCANALEEYWQTEAELRFQMADARGISRDSIVPRGPVTSTRDEVRLVKPELEGAARIIVVADHDHMARVLKTLREILSGVELDPVSTRPERYDPLLETSWIKLVTSAGLPWRLRNFLLTWFA
ncbi:MAG: ElyC/SanA/YdcF family protein [Patescibacteria group bacterium]